MGLRTVSLLHHNFVTHNVKSWQTSAGVTRQVTKNWKLKTSLFLLVWQKPGEQANFVLVDNPSLSACCLCAKKSKTMKYWILFFPPVVLLHPNSLCGHFLGLSGLCMPLFMEPPKSSFTCSGTIFYWRLVNTKQRKRKITSFVFATVQNTLSIWLLFLTKDCVIKQWLQALGELLHLMGHYQIK